MRRAAGCVGERRRRIGGGFRLGPHLRPALDARGLCVVRIDEPGDVRAFVSRERGDHPVEPLGRRDDVQKDRGEGESGDEPVASKQGA